MNDIKVRTSSSAHWYTQQGKPCHQVPYADKKRAAAGEMRDTNLGDARRLGLIPSVTTIMKILAKPQVQDWVSTNYMNAAIGAAWSYLKRHAPSWQRWTMNRSKQFKKIVATAAMEMAEEEMSIPSQLGTRIHADIEAWLMGVPTVMLPKKTLDALEAELNNTLFKLGLGTLDTLIYETERTVVHDGYAGCIDLAIFPDPERVVIIDWKTTNTKGKKKIAFYPEHVRQVAAYGKAMAEEAGVPHFDCVNVIVSRDEPGRLGVKIWRKEEVDEALSIFNQTKKLWYLINKL